MHQFLVQTRGHTLHGMIWTCTVQSDPPTFRGRILPCSQPQAWWQGRRDKPTALTWVALSELPWALWMLDSRFLFKVRLQSVPFINWTVFFLPQDLTWSYCFSSPKVKLRKSLHPATKNITLSAGNEARFWTHFMHLFIWASSFSRTHLKEFFDSPLCGGGTFNGMDTGSANPKKIKMLWQFWLDTVDRETFTWKSPKGCKWMKRIKQKTSPDIFLHIISNCRRWWVRYQHKPPYS